jgi:hypothetical protein
MEETMRREAKKVVDDHKSNTMVYDGIIYIMHNRAVMGDCPALYRKIRIFR